VLLRLAVVLNRARSAALLPVARLLGRGIRLEVEFTRDWLAAPPVTHADLMQERDFLAARGFDLTLRDGGGQDGGAPGGDGQDGRQARDPVGFRADESLDD